ncbi:hypothetical protein [Novipirellula sp.]|uniref:hypothetical protein n=1 Tax=Novipirellula sp. TaxID=2795430 RepID=UPI00356560F1
MPYGIPWNDVETIYPCVKCGYETLLYTPFCANCGIEQPTEERKQAIGCARHVTSKREPDEIQASLDEFNGFAVRLWSYGVSHCELQLHFYKTGKHRMILMCASSDEVHLPTSAWAADLELIVKAGKYGDEYIVRDRKLGHYVRCGMVVAYFGFDSSFCGDGICPW